MSQRFQEIVEDFFDYDEVLVRQKLYHADVLELRQRAISLTSVPKLKFDKQLLLFINVANGNVDDAARWLQNFYSIKQSSPEFFSNRNPESDASKFSFKTHHMSPLPTTPDNNFVFIHRIQNTEPRNYIFDDVVKMFFMMAEATVLTNGPRNGAIFISDWTGIRFGHLFCPSINSIRKSLDFIQHGCPIPMRAVHIFNASNLVQVVFSMIKPFMSKHLFDIVHVHPVGMDFHEHFFEKFIPKSSMPSDYGGDLASLSELHEKNCKVLCSFKEYFELEEKHLKHQLDSDHVDDDKSHTEL